MSAEENEAVLEIQEEIAESEAAYEEAQAGEEPGDTAQTEDDVNEEEVPEAELQETKKKKSPLAIVAGYYGTMLFGPTVQMRYVYPVMLALPYVLALVTGRRKNG